MAYHARRNIVTDNLIFQTDGNNKIGIIEDIDGAKGFGTGIVLESVSSTLYNFGDTDFTISLYAMTPNLAGVHSLINMFNFVANTTSWRIQQSTTDYRIFVDDDNVAGFSQTITATNAVLVDTWQLLTFVHDSINNELRFYINSVLVGSTPIAYTLGIFSQNIPLRVGNTESEGAGWAGSIKDIRIYTRAFNQTDANNDYDSGSFHDYTSIDKTDLVSFFPMDEASAPIIDFHGGSNLIDGGVTNYANSTPLVIIPLNITNPIQQGTLNGGMSLVNGVFVLDGIDDFIEYDSSVGNVSGTEITVSVLCKPITGIGTGSIIEKPKDAFGVVDWKITYDETNERFSVSVAGGDGFVTDTIGASPVDFIYNIVFTWTGTTSLKMFVNNVLINEDTDTVNPIQNTSDNLFIGNDFSNNFFKGDFIEGLIYSSILNTDELKQNHDAIKNRF